MSVKVPWIPTPTFIIKYIVEMLNIGSGDVVLDLGCGDGRFVVYAATKGAYGVCIEIDRVLCNVATILAKLKGVEDRVEVICCDFFEYDLRKLSRRPTVVYLYLYPSVLEMLSPKLIEELPKGTIVVSLDFAIRSWSPVFVKTMVDEHKHEHAIWIYITGLSEPSVRYVGISKEVDVLVKRLRSRKFGYV